MRLHVIGNANNAIAMGHHIVRTRGDASQRADLTIGQWVDACEAWGYLCAYCGQPPLDKHGEPSMNIEHVQPLQRGGDHSADNILPSCHSCNASKGRLFLLEWVFWQHGLLKRPSNQRVACDIKAA